MASTPWLRLASAQLPSEPGCERTATRVVRSAVTDLPLPSSVRDGLEVAVAEAVINAMEHGNGHDPDLPIAIEVSASDDRLRVCIADRGSGTDGLDEAEVPDLAAKLRGEQSERGWGRYLMRSLVDEVHESRGAPDGHAVTLELRLTGGGCDLEASTQA